MKIVSIGFIRHEDIPPDVRKAFGMAPLPPEPRVEPKVDFYEHRRALERKIRERRQKGE